MVALNLMALMLTYSLCSYWFCFDLSLLKCNPCSYWFCLFWLIQKN